MKNTIGNCSFFTFLFLLNHCDSISASENPLIFTVASEAKDGYLRYLRSADEYGLNVTTLGFGVPWRGGDMNYRGGGYKVNLLKEALEPYKDDENQIIMFTDSYDVIFLASWADILEKFKEAKAKVIFAAENFCWPDDELRSKYPPVDGDGQRFLNSGMFIGYAKNVYNILSYTDIKDTEDDQLFYTHVYLNEKMRNENNIKLDHKSAIFQNLNGNIGDISVTINKEGETKLLNKKYATNPAVVHGNGPSKINLNNFGNYLAGAYVDGECVTCLENNIPEKERTSFTVLIALFVENPTPFLEEFFDKIFSLNYPKNNLHIFVHNNVEYHEKLTETFLEHASNQKYISVKGLNFRDGISEATARELAVNRCLTKKCDYLFVVDSDMHLDNLDTLIELITFNRTVIAPIITRIGTVWSNFWGALNEKGFYARSSDYMSIVNNEIRGIWNVPFISSSYLIKSKILNKLSYTKADVDADMAFAEHLRNQEIFMYACNLNDYGHMINPDTFDIKKTRPEFYELFSNKFDWEKRFIREEYYAQLLAETVPKQPCPDVYWFPIATEIFADSMVDIMEAYGKWSDGSNNDVRLQGGYEAVPTRDIHMNQVGLEPLWLKFLQLYVRPLQEKVFIGYYHDPPRSLMNFVVRYRPDEQPFLRPHHDSSTYTINIALNSVGVDYEGGGCRFLRYNCSILDTQKGWMLMHPGRLTHFHEGLRVTKGTRYIMVSFVDP
ncbi:hypothetical protein PVAND_002485 [Polypedilum vanderplanki]|uniref:procollagen-lysine 5-dioxygenase n=1 Tax=Polypedilum vanderplanki TaxID=319348 RepID=A0A9J6BRL5_POLVA|nr:hypothetical protein PVAND_002485 [Polypedilum vanderplanki]